MPDDLHGNLQKISKQLGDLRDPSITPAPVADATAVELNAAPQPPLTPAKMTITRDGFNWTVATA